MAQYSSTTSTADVVIRCQVSDVVDEIEWCDVVAWKVADFLYTRWDRRQIGSALVFVHWGVLAQLHCHAHQGEVVQFTMADDVASTLMALLNRPSLLAFPTYRFFGCNSKHHFQ